MFLLLYFLLLILTLRIIGEILFKTMTRRDNCVPPDLLFKSLHIYGLSNCYHPNTRNP